MRSIENPLCTLAWCASAGWVVSLWRGVDYGKGIALDGAGGAYITGYTYSDDFPTTPGAYDLTKDTTSSDAFVSKISEPVQEWTTTYTYTYDPLYRLTGADYSTGEFFNYSYDAVGNRLSETTDTGATTYIYDIANRLTSVDGVTYTWDDNGNLLSDGVNTYSYDHANRLVSVVGSSTTSSNAYNGQGDRLQQTVDSVTESYTLDMNNWLTQVLSDGTNTYLYGIGRIAQYDAVGAAYFLGYALSSVRQMTDDAGAVTMSKTYQPFGNVMQSVGTGSSPYGFTNEWADGTGLVYLRARYYEPGVGRFITKDVWPGDFNNPMSLNPWLYGYNNPIKLIDPTGKVPECDRYQRTDLTQWLIDEMNENRKSYIFTIIWTGLHFPDLSDILYPGPSISKLPADLVSIGIAYGLFYDVVKTHGLWDFKWKIERVVGKNIQLTDRWFLWDVPGNIYFGFFGGSAGFDKRILHCGADYATDGRLCSGSDPIEDYEAIEAGYDIQKMSRWGPVNKHILKFALVKHPLIATGIPTETKQESFTIPWPYTAGTFDDGSSGWIIKRR